MLLLDTYKFKGHYIHAYAESQCSDIWFYKMPSIMLSLDLKEEMVEHCEICDRLSELDVPFADEVVDYLEEGEY